jgi:hypothetical protein
MKYHDPLKKILSQARPYWDQDEMRSAARGVFSKALQCRTAELGAEVYSSENREPVRVVATGPAYSGYASDGPHCQTRSIRGSRFRCRMYFGLSSVTTRP